MRFPAHFLRLLYLLVLIHLAKPMWVCVYVSVSESVYGGYCDRGRPSLAFSVCISTYISTTAYTTHSECARLYTFVCLALVADRSGCSHCSHFFLSPFMSVCCVLASACECFFIFIFFFFFSGLRYAKRARQYADDKWACILLNKNTYLCRRYVFSMQDVK